jgi:hypothetical protein
MTICPQCGGNTNHARLALSKGWPLETVQDALENSVGAHRLTSSALLVIKRERDAAIALLKDINNGTDCDVTGVSGCKIDGILLTREFVARVNKFLQTTNSATGAQE